MAIHYTVTVSNRSDIRQGWRVACFGTEVGNSDARALYVSEHRYRTEAAAMRAARALAASLNATLLGAGR
jgi:hypothetical protein